MFSRKLQFLLDYYFLFNEQKKLYVSKIEICIERKVVTLSYGIAGGGGNFTWNEYFMLNGKFLIVKLVKESELNFII